MIEDYTVGYDEWKEAISSCELFPGDIIITDCLVGFDRYMTTPMTLFNGTPICAKSVRCDNLDFLHSLDRSKIIPYMLLQRKIVQESYIFRYAEINTDN